MNAATARLRLAALVERFDAMEVRRRGMLSALALVLLSAAWQALLMDPLAARRQRAEQRLEQARKQFGQIEMLGASLHSDPLLAAAERNRALHTRLAMLDGQLQADARGYASPQQVTVLLRDLLAAQHGLTLVSLANLPPRSLTAAPAVPGAPTAADAPATAEADQGGPYLHPVELVVEGSYGDILAYLRALEGMPWQIYWQRLELQALDFPSNRARIVVGALSLSRQWISL
jgi:MSHA biogenesis protein MshJ